MTAVADAVRRPGLFDEVEPRTMLFWGAIGGVTAAFIAAIGMFQVFDARKIVDPFLSLGFVSIMWIPLFFGYRASHKPVLEGMEAPRVGAHNVVAGVVVGSVAGAGLGAFIMLADAVHLRDILINVTPALVNLLAFGQPAVVGALLMIIGGATLGGVGGALHLMPSKSRGALGAGIMWIFVLSFLELVFGNILRELGARNVDRMIYTPNRALTLPTAAIVFALAAVIKYRFAGRGKAAAVRYRAMPDERRRRVMFLTAVGLLALGSLLPAVFGTFLNDVLSNAGLFMLLAFGLNIVVGYAGLLDLGYVAFFAVGAYTTAVVTSAASPSITPELAFFEALPWVLLMAAVAGLIIGTPVIRMRGDYLAIVTLGFGEIARLVLLSDWLSNVFGAAQGIIRIAPLAPGSAASGIRVYFGYVLAGAGLVLVVLAYLRWRETARARRGEVMAVPGATDRGANAIPLALAGAVAIVVGMIFPTFLTWTIRGIHPQAMFRIILVFVGIAAFVSWRLQESRVGRAWMAVREDEQIAQTMGINIVTTKLLAFVMGAMLASFGGALFAVKLGTVFPHSFEIQQSIIILVVVIVGGMGSLRGVALGALVLIGILGGPTQPGLLREFGEFKMLLYGVILVWMMLQRPEGLWPSARRSRELHQEEMLQDAWLKSQADGTAQAGERP